MCRTCTVQNNIECTWQGIGHVLQQIIMHDVLTVYNARALVRQLQMNTSAHVCYIHAVVSVKSRLHAYGAHATIKEVLWQLAMPVSHTVL